MANIKIGNALGDDWLADLYDTGSLDLISKSSTKTVFKDQNGFKIVFTGKGFQFKGNDTTAGTVKGVQFLDSGGASLLNVTGVAFDQKLTTAAYVADKIFGLMTLLTSGNDTIRGSANGEDVIIGDNAGNDTIEAGPGDDFVKGSAGNNTMRGGGDFDTLSYQDTFYDKKNATKGIVLDVAKGTVKNSWGGADKISAFEEYRGSHLADTIKGSAADYEQFMGLGGKDVIDGGGGNDEIRYNRDDRFGGVKGILADLAKGTIKDGFGTIDTVRNIESVVGTVFKDTFLGSAKDDTFRGLAGIDSYDGRGGSDTLELRGAGNAEQEHGAQVDLRLTGGQVIDDGYGNAETIKNIENIAGGMFGDRLTMGAADGSVDGRGGDDTLTAGSGENIMTGDDGADTFVFLSAADSLAGTATRDFIDDFSQGEGDHLDLSALGPLQFVGTTAFTEGGGGQIAYRFNTDGNTIVSADIDGNGTADLQFLLHGKIDLTANDFILA